MNCVASFVRDFILHKNIFILFSSSHVIALMCIYITLLFLYYIMYNDYPIRSIYVSGKIVSN